MSISYKKAGQRSLIAIAVVSLSACSTAPRIPDDLNNLGQGLVNAGKSTADFSRRAWDKTSYLLGFTDDDPGAAAQSQPGMVREPLQQRREIPGSADAQMRDAQWVDHQTVSRDQDLADIPLSSHSGIAQPEPLTETPVSASGFEPVQERSDLRYTVTSNENLWNIAKATTGDATNWHLLADINDLAPHASVYPGQTLIIPADMVKPGYVSGGHSDADSGNDMDLAGELDNVTAGDAAQPADAGPLMVSSANDAGTRVGSDRVSISGQPFELKPGESLWDLAKRTTGDAMNWEPIALHNQLSAQEATLVYAGQTIFVPETMLLDAQNADPLSTQAMEQPSRSSDTVSMTPTTSLLDETATLAFDTQDDKDGSRQKGSEDPLPEPVFNTQGNEPIGALASLSVPGKATDSVTFNSVPALQIAEQSKEHLPDKAADNTVADRTTAGTLSSEQGTTGLRTMQVRESSPGRIEVSLPVVKSTEGAARAESGPAVAAQADNRFPDEVLVSGSYYPKAVYNEADFSSSLLMRVSPGTRLQVSDAFGTWYQVVTEKGTGYVHQRDIR